MPGGRLIVGGFTGSLYGAACGSWCWRSPPPGESTAAGASGAIVALDWHEDQPAVLWLRSDGTKRMEWGLEGRASAAAAGEPRAVRRHAVDRNGQVYVVGATGYEGSPLVTRLNAFGAPTLGFGRQIAMRVPLPKGLAQAIGEDVAVGPGARVYVAASAADRIAFDREDYGFTHALVARLKGWSHLISIAGRHANPPRQIYAGASCYSRGCRMRVEVRDRRGHRIGLRRGRSELTTVRTSRRLRPGERLTIRISAPNARGQADRTVRRLTVPRRRR
jgi:hypothetical protein